MVSCPVSVVEMGFLKLNVLLHCKVKLSRMAGY